MPYYQVVLMLCLACFAIGCGGSESYDQAAGDADTSTEVSTEEDLQMEEAASTGE